jgi:hypothetical protein
MSFTLNLAICSLTDVIGNKYVGVDIVSSLLSKQFDLWENSFPTENQFIEMRVNKAMRDKGKFHITVINVMEFNKLIKDDSDNRAKLEKLLGNPVKLELVGIGTAEDNKKGNIAHFIVVDSPELDEIRNSFDLKKQDFHITLGFDKKDVFGKSKAKDSIFIKF